MISPQLLAEMPGGYRGPTPDQDLVESPDLANVLLNQQQTNAANLPAVQAAASQAETARSNALTQGANIENQESQAQLPLYLQYIARKQALMNAGSPSQGQDSNQQSPLPPQYQGSQGQDQPSAFDTLKNLSQQAAQEKNMNLAFPKMPSSDAQIALQNAQAQTKANLDKELATGSNPNAPIDPVTGQPMTWQKQALALGPGKVNAAGGLGDQFIALHPEANYLSDADKAAYTKDKLFSAPTAAIFANQYNQPLQPEDISYYAQQLADSKMDMKEVVADIGSRMTGAAKADTIAQIQQQAQKQDPTFAPVSNEADAAYFSSPKIKTTMGQVQQAYQTIQAINDDLGSMDNGQYPTMNAAKQFIGKESGMPMGALANIDKIIGIDEIAPVLSRTGTNTDNVRSLAGQLADPTRSPAQQQAVTQALLKAFGRTLNSYGQQMGGFSDLQPALKTDKTPTPANPQDAQAAAWAKANPNDPRSSAILRKLGQ